MKKRNYKIIEFIIACILTALTISFSSCNLWIFGSPIPHEVSTKKYSDLGYFMKLEKLEIKDNIYSEFVNLKLKSNFLDNLIVDKYNFGWTLNESVIYDNRLYNDSCYYVSQRKVWINKYAKKYNIEKEYINVYPNGKDPFSENLISLNISFWRNLTKEEYINNIIKDTLSFWITYKKGDRYDYNCVLVEKEGFTELLLKEVAAPLPHKKKINYDKVHKKAVSLFKKKILRKIR